MMTNEEILRTFLTEIGELENYSKLVAGDVANESDEDSVVDINSAISSTFFWPDAELEKWNSIHFKWYDMIRELDITGSVNITEV